MPLIAVYPDVIRAYNRVEIDWSDTPSVDYAKVVRVDAETGECTALRPYICYSGDYLNVSCDGHGIFWDTEVPLDRSVYYITEGLGAPCIPTEPEFYDYFNRIVSPSWGTADSGQLWTHVGAAADFFVNGTRGVHSHPAANTLRVSTIETGSTDGTFQADIIINAPSSGAALGASVVGRYADASNYYMARISLTLANEVTITLRKRVAGVETNVSSSVVVPDTAPTITGGAWTVKFSYIGSNLAAKLWPVGSDEPTGWQTTGSDTSLTTGTRAGLRSLLDVGSTNAVPFQYLFDNFLSSACAPCDPTTASTIDTPTTMASNGAFRLKDPVRPCNDLYVPLCFEQVPQPGCLPGSGIFFASMDTESYEPNTLLLNPTNASLPIAVSRARRGKTSMLQLVTRTFDDRDNLLRINAPGSPLLLQGPPNYGISQAYISVGTVSIVRGLTDHRFPVRINNLPFTTVTRPAGPSQGVCGSRVEDACDIYDTWAEVITEGLTFEDFVRGRASTDDTGQALRTWGQVNSEFADWAAVEANGTWNQLKAGE